VLVNDWIRRAAQVPASIVRRVTGDRGGHGHTIHGGVDHADLTDQGQHRMVVREEVSSEMSDLVLAGTINEMTQ
jgi:hypothetical protein